MVIDFSSPENKKYIDALYGDKPTDEHIQQVTDDLNYTVEHYRKLGQTDEQIQQAFKDKALSLKPTLNYGWADYASDNIQAASQGIAKGLGIEALQASPKVDLRPIVSATQGEAPPTIAETIKHDAYTPQTDFSKGLETVSKYTMAMVGASKLLKGLGVLSKAPLARDFVAGAISDFTMYDPKEGRLSDALNIPLLSTRKDGVKEDWLEGATKNTVEGVIFGGVAHLGFAALGKIAKGFTGLAKAKTTDQIAQATNIISEGKTELKDEAINATITELKDKGIQTKDQAWGAINHFLTPDELNTVVERWDNVDLTTPKVNIDTSDIDLQIQRANNMLKRSNISEEVKANWTTKLDDLNKQKESLLNPLDPKIGLQQQVEQAKSFLSDPDLPPQGKLHWQEQLTKSQSELDKIAESEKTGAITPDNTQNLVTQIDNSKALADIRKNIGEAGVLDTTSVKKVIENTNSVDEAVKETFNLAKWLRNRGGRPLLQGKVETTADHIDNTNALLDEISHNNNISKEELAAGVTPELVKDAENTSHALTAINAIQKSIDEDRVTAIDNIKAGIASGGDRDAEIAYHKLTNLAGAVGTTADGIISQIGRTLHTARVKAETMAGVKIPLFEKITDPAINAMNQAKAKNIAEELIRNINELNPEDTIDILHKKVLDTVNKLGLQDEISPKIARQTAESLYNEYKHSGVDGSIIKDAGQNEADYWSKRQSIIQMAQSEALASSQGQRTSFLKSFRNTFIPNAVSNLSGGFIHSILSGPTTWTQNFYSGLLMSFKQPAEKMIGGAIVGDKQLAEEGALHFLAMSRNLQESLRLAFKAVWHEEPILARYNLDQSDHFLDNITGALLDNPTPKVWSAASWNIDENTGFGKVMDAIGTYWRIATRIGMLSSNEALTQFNYRNVAYARSLQAAKANLQMVNKDFTHADLLNEAEEIFKQHFTPVYHPKFNEVLDIANQPELYHEARSGLFEGDTSGKFVTPTVVMDAAQSVKDFTNKHPAAKFLIPFVNALAIITEEGIDSTVAPLTKKFWTLKENAMRLGATEMDKRKYAISRGKYAIGCGIMAVSAIAAMSGKVTGSEPADPIAAASLRKQGWKPFSIVFDNPDGTKTFLPYQNIEPIATILGLTTDMYNAALNNPDTYDFTKMDHVIYSVANSITQNITNKSFIKALMEQVNWVQADNEKDMKNALARFGQIAISTVVPNSALMRYFSNDGQIREARNIVDQLKMQSDPFGVTGLRSQVPIRYNDLGEPMGYDPASRSAGGQLLPFKGSYKYNGDALDQKRAELGRLGWMPPDQTKSMAGLNLLAYTNKDGETAFDAIKREKGQIKLNGLTLRETLNKWLDSPSFKSLVAGVGDGEDAYKDTSQKGVFNKVYSDFLKAAQQKVLRSNEYLNSKGNSIRTDKQAALILRQYTRIGSEDQRILDLEEQLNGLYIK